MQATRALAGQRSPALPMRRVSQHHKATAARRVAVVRCQAQDEQRGGQVEQLKQLMAATAMAGVLLMSSAAFPEDAMAARSGGRVGGSAGFRSQAAAPR